MDFDGNSSVGIEILLQRNVNMNEDREKIISELQKILYDYAKACAEAKLWGGPTIHPQNPITEQTALYYAVKLQKIENNYDI